MTLNIATINVRSIKSTVRAQAIFTLLENTNTDIFLLQECGLPFLTNYSKWQATWPRGPSIWSGSNENKADGVVVLVKNLHVKVKGSTVVSAGRALLTNLTYVGQDFKILNIYGPNDVHERCELLDNIQPHLMGRTPLVVAGDFNCVLERMGRQGAADDFRVDKSSVKLQTLYKDFRLEDCFKTLHPGEVGYTWFSSDRSRASRIDYVLTRDLTVSSAKLNPVFFSDHLMLACTLSFTTGVTIGKGFWKLNCLLLEDQKIVEKYRERYQDWQTLQDFFPIRAQWWEMVKGKTKSFFMVAGRRKRQKEERVMLGLQKRLNRLFNLTKEGCDFNEEIKEVKEDMKTRAYATSKGIMFRSRAREIEEGERCTRYFF